MHFLIFGVNGGALLPVKFMLNMVQGHHLQLRSHPHLFCNFKWFNIKAAASHLPTIQKEVGELLAKGVIEASSGGVVFYSSVFVVPKHTGGFRPILNFKQLNHYLHTPSLRCLLSECTVMYSTW